MVEVLVAAIVAVVVLTIVGVIAASLAMVLWVVFLPFQLLGLFFKGLGILLVLPFLALFGIAGFLIFGFGAALFLVPVLPFALVVYLIWRWMSGRPRANVTA